MSGLIDRIQERTATTNERARVLEMTDGDADEVLDALSSETSRATFQALFEEPRTPSEIADRVDTSVQNVHYHVSKLEDAALIEPVETVYSEKGNEMTVYGPASDPLVIVGILAAAALFVQWGAERLMRQQVRPPSAVGPASPDVTLAPPEGSVAWIVFEVVEPGVLFFFGAVLVAMLALAFVRR